MIFFFNDTATTEIYTLSLHDALPISGAIRQQVAGGVVAPAGDLVGGGVAAALDQRAVDLDTGAVAGDRKSTRLNSSHANISYAVFCLKKKKNQPRQLICHLR